LFPLTARAQSDWIDDLPAVTSVGQAVAEQLKVDTADWRFDQRGIALKDDDDLFAVYMAGTLVLLRQLILYKYQEEPSMSPLRKDRLRAVVAAYLEAELVIGQGVGARRGYLTTAQKCRDSDCYHRWFKTGMSNVRGASYRGRIFKRLFCDEARAEEFDRLAQSYATRAPYLPSPAENLSIEPEFAGIAPAGCSTYGGDGDHNKLCDDWQKTPLASTADASACGAVARPNQPVFKGGTSPDFVGSKPEIEDPWVEVMIGVQGYQEGVKCDETNVTVKDCEGDVRTQKSYSGECPINDGISIRIKCSNAHLVQFISREYWTRRMKDSQTPDSNLEEGFYGAAPYTPDPDDAKVQKLACYRKTDNIKNRRWRTDSIGKPNPYYDSGGAYRVCGGAMTTLDAPSAPGFDPEKYLVARIVAKSFAVCGCKVVAVIDWQRDYVAAKPTEPFYTVNWPRNPTPDEITQFQGLSKQEDFKPWPFTGEECKSCAR
jgi:hypothetical protein